MATTWSTTNLNARVILSNGNLTCKSDMNGNIDEQGRSDSGVSTSAKIYWEVTCDLKVNNGDTGIGVSNSSEAFNDGNWLGIDANSCGMYGNGQVYISATVQTTIQTFGTGDVICIAVDGTHSKIWFRTNSGNWNNDVIGNQDPANNIGGISISTLGAVTVFPGYNVFFINGTGQAQWTANFSASPSFTIPSGFTTFDSGDTLFAQAVM